MTANPRRGCAFKGCFATFSDAKPRDDEVRHCNRSGPDGGHANRWDGRSWQTADGAMQHDRGAPAR